MSNSEDSLLNSVLDSLIKGKNIDEITNMMESDFSGKIEEKLRDLGELLYTKIEKNISNLIQKIEDEEDKFLYHNYEVWGECFNFSRIFYFIIVDFTISYNQYVKNTFFPKPEIQPAKYVVLQHIHARACQQYLEVLTLLKNGFADGAFARWRSIHELACIAGFIVQSDNADSVSLKYREAVNDDKNYEWARIDTRFQQKKGNITFQMIEDNSGINTLWREEYKFACKVLHGSPEGTFKRVGSPGTINGLLIGQSDFGMAYPATHAAHSLFCVTAAFLNCYSYAENTVFLLALEKFSAKLKALYIEADEKCFQEYQNKDAN